MRLLLALLICFASPPLFAADEPASIGSEVSEIAKQQYQKGRLSEALATLDRSADKTAGALDLRGLISTEEGKYAEAAQSFAAAHRADASLFAPRLHAADLLMRQKKFSDARAEYEALLKETNVLSANERLRFAVLITYLAEKNETEARASFEGIKFPTQSAAYYYAQVAWESAHGNSSGAKKWMSTAGRMFDPTAAAWFERPLFELGWLKQKPPLSSS